MSLLVMAQKNLGLLKSLLVIWQRMLIFAVILTQKPCQLPD
jgi:hypothetical protein